MRLPQPHVHRLIPLASLALALTWPLQAHALFGDDEARKAIIELRQKVDANQQAAEAARKALETSKQDNDATTRRSLLELSNQIEQLRAEMARLRGLNEQLAREVSELQRQQKDVQTGLDERLRQVEPIKITHDEVSFTAAPAEKREFDAALEQLRRSEFTASIDAYAAFLRRYPQSGYTPSALYWLGNAQYATRAYAAALETHRRLVTQFPSHVRTPEALLAMANSQVELKDTKGARRTLDQLVKDHPQSEAATAGKERLARLR
ncbi:tol-pal system protein YbgF [Hydrogenophaga sp.]|uniref:tol-pal system protein YbgF n=1 Tax=Hydrogenophaga sp. TaxID=1904254 RepID=UPI0025BB740A|nr:tol-pal system protein YbgF [Hydrogenophaga sp.]